MCIGPKTSWRRDGCFGHAWMDVLTGSVEECPHLAAAAAAVALPLGVLTPMTSIQKTNQNLYDQACKSLCSLLENHLSIYCSNLQIQRPDSICDWKWENGIDFRLSWCSKKPFKSYTEKIQEISSLTRSAFRSGFRSETQTGRRTEAGSDARIMILIFQATSICMMIRKA